MDDINHLKESLKAAGTRGIALDVDETLADTNNHWFDHMFEFHPLEGIDKKEVVERYKFVEHVPGWGHQEALDRMTALMHSDDFNETIPLIEDANRIVNKIHKTIPVVAYITARPQTVRASTSKWLAKHGFPSVPLIMRPADVGVSMDESLNKNVWKARVLVSLYPEVIGIVDDNLGLSHELAKLDYQGTLYLYGPQTESVEGSKRVVLCPTWRSVLPAVLERIGDA